jgi:hypothetical protein
MLLESLTFVLIKIFISFIYSIFNYRDKVKLQSYDYTSNYKANDISPIV